MEKLLHYARKHGYTPYTSTLAEAWRLSLSGISESLHDAADRFDEPPSLDADTSLADDPLVRFGVVQARAHRERGINLSMFLGLFKYYRQSYLDMIDAFAKPEDKASCLEFTTRCFDMMELGMCEKWSEGGEASTLEALRSTNRHLANEKNRYLTLVESLPLPTLLLDAQGEMVYMNHAMSRILDPKNFPGSHYYGRNTAIDGMAVSHGGSLSETRDRQWISSCLPWLVAEVTDLADSGELTRSFERSLRLGAAESAGCEGLFEVNLSRMLDISGKFTGTIVSFSDISDRRAAEDSLRESERRFRNLFENAPLAYQSLNAEGRILDVNHKWLSTLGYCKEEAVGSLFQDLLGSEFKEHFFRNFPKFKESCVINDVEFELRRKDGSTILVSFNGRVQTDRFGGFQRTHCIFTDITRQRRDEELLQASLREKETLLKEIHHRVKNNLQIISSLLSLQSTKADGLSTKLLRESQSRIRSMALVHEELYTSGDMVHIDLKEYSSKLMSKLQHWADGKKIRCRLDAMPIELNIRQAIPCGLLMNELVTNALKHAFRGRPGGDVRVSLNRTRERISMIVADNGIGFPAGEHVSGHPPGLGLQLIESLVDQLGGTMRVESCSGTTFSIEFAAAE